MGTNLSSIYTRIRQVLRDEIQSDSSHEFEDDELVMHINRALNEVSEASPRERKVTLTATAGSKEISLVSYTDDLIEVVRAEYPVGQDPPKYRNVELFGSTARLIVDSAPSAASVYFYLLSLHELTVSSSTMNKNEEDCLVIGASAYAAEAWLNVMRTELKEAFALLTTVEASVGVMTARVAQAVTDLASARAKVNSITVANAVRDYGDIASRELSASNAYLNQSIGYLRQMTSQLSEPRAITAYHSKINQQLAEYRDRLNRITKPRSQREYSRA